MSSIVLKGKNPLKAIRLLQKSTIVCFDVDSTLSRHEGLEELSEFIGTPQTIAKIKEITSEAMNGSIDYQTSLHRRLELLSPSRSTIHSFVSTHPVELTKGAKELVSQLQRDGKEIYLISGGFEEMIEPLRSELSVPSSHVFCNAFLFDEGGNYASFDRSRQTSQSHGKRRVIEKLRAETPHCCATMIGDGATDLEAAEAADCFIGYGGVQYRPGIEAEAMLYVSDFTMLHNIYLSARSA